MILTCPACATQYRLKDGAIPPEGRQVRCAACKHKWHEDGASVADPAVSDEAYADDATPAAAADDDQTVGIAPPQPDPDVAAPAVATIPDAAARDEMIAEEPQPLPEPGGEDYRPEAEAANQWNPPEPHYEPDDGFAAIPAMHDEDEPRRSILPWIVGVVLLVVAAAAAFYFFAPADLKARAGIAESGESPLELQVTTQDRQELASGNELLAISGRVINLTDREQAVPPLRAELRDPTSNKLVYQWTIAAPARSLGPGQSAPFNSAEVDVPKVGETLLTVKFAS
jgi:predicted Zn finger-like uncharacterized protein